MITPCSSCGRENRIPAARLNARARCAECKAAILPLAQPFEVKDEATFEELVRESPLPVGVDFWAAWCGPCHMIAPELKTLAPRYAARVVIAKVNSDDLGEIAGRYRIRGIPTLVRFDAGTETKRTSGAQNADMLVSALGLEAGPSAEQPAAPH